MTGDGPRPVSHGGAPLRSTQAGPFTVSEVVYAASLDQDLHRHARACATFVMHGGFTEQVVGDRTRCGPRQALLKPPGLLHACRDGVAGTRCLTLEVAEEGIDSLGPVGTLWRRASYLEWERLWSLVCRVQEELRSTDAAGPLALEGLCMDLLAELYRLTCRPRGEVEPAWLRDAVELVRASRGRRAELTELSDQVGVDRSHLAREFRRHHGLTVGQYARQLRVQHACELLLRPELTLAQIAVDAGFYDQSHLTNVFRRHVGVTPAVYRERLRAK